MEEGFGGFIERYLVGFEYEKSPLHTITYGGTRIGKISFVIQYLKLYRQQNLTDGLSPCTFNEDKTKVIKNLNNVLAIREGGSPINKNQSLNLCKTIP